MKSEPIRKLVEINDIYGTARRLIEHAYGNLVTFSAFKNDIVLNKGLIDPREQAVVEIFLSSARLLTAWHYVDSRPDDPHGFDSLDYAEDWLRSAFNTFVGGKN